MPRIYTKTGDDGTTGLLYGGRVAKDDPRTEAYGTCDEAVAALGLARASTTILNDVILRLQRELFVVGAELATDPAKRDSLKDGITRVTSSMVAALEALIDEYASNTSMPKEFVIPGEHLAAAALDLARAIVRRAERLAVGLQRGETAANPETIRYLNRLSDLLFVLARHEEGTFTPLHPG